jgi:hypothetical protein
VGPYRVERSSQSWRRVYSAARLPRSNSVSGAARAAPLRRNEFGEASPHAARHRGSSLGILWARTELNGLALRHRVYSAARLPRSNPGPFSSTNTTRRREKRRSCLASGPRLERTPRRGTRPRRASHGRG